FAQKENDVFAVGEQKLIVRPIRNLIEPNRSTVQKEERKTQQKEQHPFENFEEGDDFEITNATRLLQNRRNMRRITHPPTLRRTLSLRNDWIFAAADFQFVAVGIFKEKAIVSGAVIDADFRAFQILAADLAHEFCNSIYSFAGVRPK